MRETPAPRTRTAPRPRPTSARSWSSSKSPGSGAAAPSAPRHSAAQTRVMYIIEREPGINASTLGRRLSAAAPSVTRLCDRLQAAGFLRRTPRPQDRREMQLELTDSGTAHLHGIRHRRELALQQAMSRMAPDARHALATGLSALCDAVSEPTQSLGHRETA